MADQTIQKLQQQITRVNRRLFMQTWLNSLLLCVTGTLLLAALWLVIHPFLFGPAEAWLRWTIVAGGLGLGVLLAYALAWRNGPGRVESALALDDRFGLKERVTTFLTLTEEQAQSPAGQALLEDVQKHAAALNVTSRFPLRVNWKQALVPVVAASLAALAVFFEPDLKQAGADAKDKNTLSLAKAKAIEDKMQELKKKLEEKKLGDQAKSKQLEDLELKMEQIFEKGLDPKNKDENRKKAEQIQKLEQETDKLVKEAQAALQKKSDLEQQMKDLDKFGENKDDKKNDGPAKDLMDAIKQGDPKKAEEEAKKLQDKLAGGKLNPEEMKKLEQQLGQMQDQAKEMAKKEQELEKKLDEAKNSGKASTEEIKKLEQQLQDQKDMKKLEQQLGECKNCAKDGDGKKAGEKLGECQGQMAKAAEAKGEMQKQMQSLAKKEAELKQLKANQQMLQEARQNICQNIGMGNGKQGGPNPGGLRSSQEAEFKAKDEQQGAAVDDKGQFKVVGDGPVMGGKKNKISAKELPGVFQETAQEAQQAIERQPISQEAAELLKGYYQNLSGQKK